MGRPGYYVKSDTIEFLLMVIVAELVLVVFLLAVIVSKL